MTIWEKELFALVPPMSVWLFAVRSTANLVGAFVLLLPTMTGCITNRAIGPYFEDIIHPNPDEAIVYFYRPAGPDTPKLSHWIYAFDQVIRVDQGGYTFQMVPPGRYRISLDSQPNAEDLWLDVNRGQTAFFKWGPEGDIRLVDETQALKELPGYRLMQLDPGGRP